MIPALSDSAFGKIASESKIVAVLVIDDLDSAVPLAESLLHGGVTAMELTLRTPVALDAAAAIRNALPEMRVGIGTILTPEQVDACVDMGAEFGVSPGINVEVVRRAKERGLPFGPGVMTPSEVDLALREGCHYLKFFPAESSGGLAHLKNIAAPYAHLGVQFLPLGGINLDNFESWLASPLVAAVGGSWIAPRSAIHAKDWAQIKHNALAATDRIRQQS